MKLSILICGLEGREKSRRELLSTLASQYIGDEVEILQYVDDGKIKIGDKRNELMSLAKGDYVCFIDDDDMVSKDYILKLLTAIEKNPDCCSLMGVMTWNGIYPQVFEHSIQYKEYKTIEDADIMYERYPNHLNAIKSSIAKQFIFPSVTHGEDTDWATQIHRSGLLKTEVEIPGIIYHYQYTRK